MRLQRVGRKHEPAFRLVLTDSKNSPKSGKFLDILGNYNARTGDISLNEDKIKHWLSKGVQTSDTVHNIFVDKKLIDSKKINKLPKKTVKIKEGSEEKTPTDNTESVKTTENVPEVKEEVSEPTEATANQE